MMRSGELAKLSGVTQRTLRHYRSIGLLPEPSRNESGYCEYRFSDLVLLFRIKNLRALGFSLEKISTILAEHDALNSAEEPDFLDQLDQELLAQIQHIERQRQTIAVLKSAKVNADTPESFAGFMAQLAQSGYPSKLYEKERDFLLLADNLLEEDDRDSVSVFYEKLSKNGLVDRYKKSTLDFYALSDDASESDRARIAQEFAELLGPLVEEMGVSKSDFESVDNEAVDSYLAEFDYDVLGETQRDVTLRVLGILTESYKMR